VKRRKRSRNRTPQAPATPETRRFSRGRVAVVAALAALFGLVGIARPHVYLPARQAFATVRPFALSGDEPHYMVAVNSILHDHDLDLREDYDRAKRGGWEAGALFRGRLLDHHSWVIDRQTGERSPWFKMYRLASCGKDCVTFAKTTDRFPDPEQTREAGWHPMAFPALLAAGIAWLRPSIEETEEKVSAVMFVFWAAAAALAYLAARRAGASRPASLAATALLVLASPWLAYVRSFSAEVPIGLALLLGLLAMQAERPVWAGAAIAMAMFMKPPFVIVGAAWLLDRLLARRFRQAAGLGAALAAGGVLLLAFNFWYVRGPLTPGPDPPDTLPWVSLWRTLLEPSYGLLLFVPWTLALLAGGWRCVPQKSATHDSLVRQVLLAAGLYCLVLLTNQGPGACYGPRYWVPLLPMFAVATVVWAKTASKLFRVGLVVLALSGTAVAIPGFLSYHSLWQRPVTACWQSGPGQAQ
jgi:hypothetical protein